MPLLLYVISLFYLLPSIFSIEENIREQHLQPRHFNPHPYHNEIRRSQGVGPVVFPSNEEQSRNTINAHKLVERVGIHSVDEVPYQKVARKYKKKKNGRFDPQEEKINSRLQKALAKHGAKVLKLPPEELATNHIPFSRDVHKRHNYAFSYKVLDHSSGDDFSHSQTQDSKATNGEYRVKLPDGRLQIVSYIADQNGYKADVKYMESASNHVEELRQDPIYQIEQIPVRELRPVKTNTNHHHTDYYDEVLPARQLKTVMPTAVPLLSYDGYGNYQSAYDNIVVTPTPGYSNGAVSANANYQLPLPLNVQIYTTNARDYSVGSYIPVVSSTPHTYHSSGINHYRHQSISPQIINNGDHGIVLPVSTPSSFVITDQHGQVIDNIKLVTTTALPFVVSTTPAPVGYVQDYSQDAHNVRYK